MKTNTFVEMTGYSSGSVVRRPLAAAALLAVVVALAAKADTELPGVVVTAELPGITVTAKTTQRPPDIVSRDRAERSPDVHWPSALSLQWSEMFAHNEIEINAASTTVWDHLVQARRWPQWYPIPGKVKIRGSSPILQKDTRFTWSGFDLPLDVNVFGEFNHGDMDSTVFEYVPDSRIGWLSCGPETIHGPLCVTYHTWLLTPTGTNRCHVVFEEVATGPAAEYTRGSCAEILHASHQQWLEQLKKVSEGRTSQGSNSAGVFRVPTS